MSGWAITAAVAAVIALCAILLERRRVRRRNIESVGFMPWTLLTVLAVFLAVFAAAIALNGY